MKNLAVYVGALLAAGFAATSTPASAGDYNRGGSRH